MNEQRPSPSNPNAPDVPVRVIEGSGAPELLSTPTEVSSTPSNGPTLGSVRIVRPPPGLTTISTAQLGAEPIAGHSLNGGDGFAPIAGNAHNAVAAIVTTKASSNLRIPFP